MEFGEHDTPRGKQTQGRYDRLKLETSFIPTR
jgi:hypothetical protein